jgi:AraC-like DNA-binding protein
VHRKSLCLLCEADSANAGRDGEDARLLSWRLDNIVLTRCCDRGLALRFNADHSEQARDGLIRLIHVLVPAKAMDRLRLKGSLEPLDSNAIHLVGMAQEIITCVGGQSMAFIPYSAVGYNPARHPPHLRIDLDSPAGSVLGPVLTTLWNELDDLRENEAPAIAAGLAGLLRGLITDVPARARAHQTATDARRAAIVSHIEQNLSDPALGIAKIEAALGTARSTMFRDFERYGGVEHYIKRRRLEHAFITLAHWEQAHGSIAELSSQLGFSSRNHFSRVFNTEFGCRPSDVRSRAAIPAVASDPANKKDSEATAKLETIASWLTEIRRD